MNFDLASHIGKVRQRVVGHAGSRQRLFIYFAIATLTIADPVTDDEADGFAKRRKFLAEGIPLPSKLSSSWNSMPVGLMENFGSNGKRVHDLSERVSFEL